MDPAFLAQVIFNLKKLEKEEKKKEKEAKEAAAEDFEPGQEEEKEEKEFRFQSKSVFLTYAQCGDLTPEDVLECLEEKFPHQIKEHDICREPHESGDWHIHALVTFKEKIRSRDPRLFDLYPVHGTDEYLFHPHIQSTKNKQAVRSYIYKGHGDFAPQVISSQRYDWSKHGNHKKRREDFIAYKRDLLLARQPKTITSFRAYNMQFLLEMGQKKRHYWFFGEFSTGKSTEVYNNNFRGKVLNFKVRAPHGDSYWGCFDNYSQERYIIFDDSESKLSKGLICNLSAVEDSELGETPVACRYKDVVWFNQVIIIVLSNEVPGYHFQEDWREQGWFQARFNFIEIVKDGEGMGKIGKVNNVELQ